MKAASDFFRTEEKLNCAQAVLRYFDFPPEKIAEFREFGGGRPADCAELCMRQKPC